MLYKYITDIESDNYVIRLSIQNDESRLTSGFNIFCTNGIHCLSADVSQQEFSRMHGKSNMDMTRFEKITRCALSNTYQVFNILHKSFGLSSSFMMDADLEGGFASGFSSFDDASVRRGFIRKVYALLSIQLLITSGIILLFRECQPINDYVSSTEGRWIFYVAMGLSFVLIITLTCCGNLRRITPWNLILLFVFTIVEGVLLGSLLVAFRVDAILIATGITCVLCVALTAFAFQTKFDFTVLNGVLFVLLIVLVLFGFLMIFFHSKIMILVYGCAGALLFSVYLIMDTQMMIGGKFKYSLSPEEYIFATLNLYLDIINLFIYILTIVSQLSD